MIRKINRAWFEVWGHEQAQNKMLKGLLLMTVCLLVVETFAVSILSLRAPFVVAVDPRNTAILTPSDPVQAMRESEAQRVAATYVKLHTCWNDKNIASQY